MFDLIIKGGKVFDGSGKDPKFADIGIVGDKIKEVGNLTGADARDIINASGLIVMPGFIDAHSHSDENYLVNPLADSKLRQGITTEVIGNCGSSPFPLSTATQQQLQQDIKDWWIRVDWTTAEGFFARLEAARPAINIVPLVGQGAIRAAVMGYEDRPPKSEELAQMKDLLLEALTAGCWGFSSGLIYPPGCFTPTIELIELAKLLQPIDGIYTTHIRSEGDQLLEAIEEALNIGRSAGIRVQISHLKAAGARNWGKAEKALQMIDRAVDREGLPIGFDRYTYTASANSLSSLLPNWAHQGGRQQTIEYLKDPDISERIEIEMRHNLEGAQGWGSVILSYAGSPEYEKFEGLTIKEIAAVKHIKEELLVFHILLTSNFTATICSFTMNPEETDMILTHPRCVVCTDGGARALTGPLSKGKPHPRVFGTFPKFFRNYVKEKKKVTLTEAVAKTTARTAELFNIKERGMIKPGYFADIIVINWEEFTDTATYENPKSFPDGIIAVIVNGKPVFMNGTYTDARPGRLLLR